MVWTLESLGEALKDLRGEFHYFRDTSFPEAMKGNSEDHADIKGAVAIVDQKVGRVNGDVGMLKEWRIRVEAYAAGALATTKAGRGFVGAILGGLFAIGLVALGAWLHTVIT